MSSVDETRGTKWDRSNMMLNTKNFAIRANIRNNIRRQLPQLCAHNENPQPIIIVGGGWSLKESVEELRELVFQGYKICALNGAANWLYENNFKPSMHVVMDAQEQNKSFFKYDVPGCKYFLASQCAPALFDALEGRDLTIFHVVSTNGELERKRLDQFYGKRWQEVPSSGTIGIVAPLLCRILGFRFQHWFGIDSCYNPATGAHHSYEQTWNNKEGSAEFWIAGKSFQCSAWQASQAGEFCDFLRTCGDQVVLNIHGNGVLAHILKTGYEAAELDSLKEMA